MGNPIRIWIDDERKPLPGFNVWFKTDFSNFITYVKSNKKRIEAISFDNSLGTDVEGHELMTQLEWQVGANNLKLPKLTELIVHTADANKWLPMKQTGGSIIRLLKAETRCSCKHAAYHHSMDDLKTNDPELYQEWMIKPFECLIF